VKAISISRRVKDSWDEALPGSRVAAVFDRACNLLSVDGRVTSLVLPDIGNGPLNVVVQGQRGAFLGTRPGQQTATSGDGLAIDGLSITIGQAVVWEPCPDWVHLRQHQGLAMGLASALDAALRHASSPGLLALLVSTGDSGMSDGHYRDAIRDKALRGAREVGSGMTGSSAALRRGARLLAGLGEGLTPSGDDFMVGAMLWAWLTHPQPERACQMMLKEAVPRTPVLSKALLETAAAGECSEAWHQLLQALVRGHRPDITKATLSVLAFGQTSGADALAGFLWSSQAAMLTQTGALLSG
jgi:hypothetical protein